VTTDLTSIFVAYLAGNRAPNRDGPDRREAPTYGVTATLTDDVLNVELTFRSGFVYCCYEWGCHVSLHSGERWSWLREHLAEHGVDAPSQLHLKSTSLIEEGALFWDFSKSNPESEFVRVEAMQFEDTAEEASS